jgi:AcrR family transcriptional regulator
LLQPYLLSETATLDDVTATDPTPWRHAARVIEAIDEGLRERKKRLMRQQISDTATEMFLSRGFDEVRVADVAEACGVSEKTVYNYFPTKESLLLDREEEMTAQIREAFGPGARIDSPVQAALEMLSADTRWLQTEHGGPPPEVVIGTLRRFVELIERTPSLRAAQRDMMERLVRVAAESLADRVGVNPDDPEPMAAAYALLGLWRIQFRALHTYCDGTIPMAEVREKVAADLRRAARVIDTGLWGFSMVVQGSNGRDQLRVAAEAANEARKQMMTAIKQAKEAWRQVKAEHQRHEDAHARFVETDQIHRRTGRPGRPR